MGCINLRDIDDELHAKAKAKAALNHSSLKDVIVRLLKNYVSNEDTQHRSKKKNQ